VNGAVDQAVTLAVFLIAIGAVISRVIDETVAVLAGIVAMIILAGYPVIDAFHAVDWNVIMILLGMWVITGYMVEARIPEYIAAWAAGKTRSYAGFIVLMSILSGFLSMLVDNVLVILLLGSLVAEVAVKARRDPLPPVMMVGLSANFMGTALLMGDLPPQLLHSVVGVEFMDFIVFMGKPSSFPLLTVTFIVVTLIFARLLTRGDTASIPEGIEKPRLGLTAWISIGGFIATVVGMALRPLLGYPLGFITIAGATVTALIIELLRRTGRPLPGFEDALRHVEWRALMFYAGLFSLVGGLEEAGLLEDIARRLTDALTAGPLEAYTVFYWVAGLLSMIVEHDALLLVFLYIARDAMNITGITHWGVYWGMAWSATLGSNATVAAAPALYVALTIAEERAGRKIPARSILKITVPYALVSMAIHFIITLPVWGAAT
jgi:Na+/H+ antiporter NhaD/arsenite permease-like protein